MALPPGALFNYSGGATSLLRQLYLIRPRAHLRAAGTTANRAALSTGAKIGSSRRSGPHETAVPRTLLTRARRARDVLDCCGELREIMRPRKAASGPRRRRRRAGLRQLALLGDAGNGADRATTSGGCSLSAVIWIGFRLKREMLDRHPLFASLHVRRTNDWLKISRPGARAQGVSFGRSV